MNEVQKHLVTLLQEVDEICVQHKLRYLLCGRNAKDACTAHTFVGDYQYASVLMPEQDFDKFAGIVSRKKDGDRTIEGLRNNPLYPEYSVRYVDENTTFIYGDSAHRYIHKGIFITIQKCRNIPKNARSARIVKDIDTVLAYRDTEDISSLKKRLQRWVCIFRTAMNVFGKEFMIRKILGLQRRLTSKPSQTLAYIQYRKADINIPAAMFTKVKRVKLGKSSFFVPVDTDAYLKKVYGAKWASDKKRAGVTAPHLLVTSCDLSYKELDKDGSLYRENSQITQLITERTKLNKQIKDLQAGIDRNYNLLFFTQERYTLYRRYVPVLSILRKYQKERDYDWLLLAMKDYMDAVKASLSADLPMSVHKELDKLAVQLFSYKGEFDIARRYQELMKTTPLKKISMDLGEDRLRQLFDEARDMLPLQLLPAAHGKIPARLDDGERSVVLARWDAQGELLPLLKADKGKLIPTPDVDENGNSCPIVYRQENHTYTEFMGSEVYERVFGGADSVELYRLTKDGRHIPIARLCPNGDIYVITGIGKNNEPVPVQPPVICAVDEDGAIPAALYNKEEDTLLPLFCVGADGQRLPVAKLGLGGTFVITEIDGETPLFYEDANGEAVKLDMSRFLDEALPEVDSQFFHEGDVCLELVQRDIFGRLLKIAAVLDDGSVVPAGKVDATRKYSEVKITQEPFSTLYLQPSSGEKIVLAKVAKDGRVIPVGEEGVRV